MMTGENLQNITKVEEEKELMKLALEIVEDIKEIIDMKVRLEEDLENILDNRDLLSEKEIKEVEEVLSVLKKYDNDRFQKIIEKIKLHSDILTPK